MIQNQAERRRLVALLPEVDEISSSDLRERVLDAWMAVLRHVGTDPSLLEAMPASLRLMDRAFRLVHHVRAVCALSMAAYLAYRDLYGVDLDRDAIIAGALLHDVGKVLEMEGEGTQWRGSQQSRFLRHPFTGTMVAERCGVPDHVLHIIAYHSAEGETMQRTTEGAIVHLADDLAFQPLFLSSSYVAPADGRS